MPVFFLKSITIRHLNAEELAELQGFQKESKANKASNNGVDPKINHRAKEEKCFIPYNPKAPKKVLFSQTFLKRIASLLLRADTPFTEVKKFLYVLPASVRDQLVPIIFEDSSKRRSER